MVSGMYKSFSGQPVLLLTKSLGPNPNRNSFGWFAARDGVRWVNVLRSHSQAIEARRTARRTQEDSVV